MSDWYLYLIKQALLQSTCGFSSQKLYTFRPRSKKYREGRIIEGLDESKFSQLKAVDFLVFKKTLSRPRANENWTWFGSLTLTLKKSTLTNDSRCKEINWQGGEGINYWLELTSNYTEGCSRYSLFSPCSDFGIEAILKQLACHRVPFDSYTLLSLVCCSVRTFPNHSDDKHRRQEFSFEPNIFSLWAKWTKEVWGMLQYVFGVLHCFAFCCLSCASHSSHKCQML